MTEKDESSRYQPFPVTEIQQAYLFGRRGYIELGQVSCFSYAEYDLSSNFDIERLEQAFNYLIQRHAALRIIFTSDTEQRILEKTPYYVIAICDLTDVITVEEELIKRRKQLSHQVRSADQWPLFDIQLTRYIHDNKRQFRIHIGFDLLIMDLWSIDLVLSELSQLYHNLDTILPTINYSYRDYILSQYQTKKSFVHKIDKKYWIDRLHLFPLGPRLPLHCLPKELKIQRFIRSQRVLDQSIWDRLKERIRNTQLTPAGFLASIYAIILAKWSNNQHFSINLPIFNRLPIHPQVNHIAGDFTSICPLEVNLKQKMIFSQFIQTVQKQLWNDLEHMSYDGISFIRELMHINQTREIVLPVVFLCGLFSSNSKHDTNKTHNIFGDVSVPGISQTPQVYLDNQIFEQDGKLIIRWDHVENLFPPSMIDDMQSAFIHLLNRLALSNEMWQEPVFISLPIEQLQRRVAYVNTKWDPNIESKLLHALVIEQAQRAPNTLAIQSSRKNLTYKQLMDHAYSLAYHLKQQGVQSNQLIAILMKKGWEQIIGCLAILLSGGAYLPLDIDSPYDRLSSLIEETNIKIILTQSDCSHLFEHLISISVDTFTFDNYPKSFPIKQQLSTDLAYVIYTSGSTGKPKGVMISHQAVLNTILNMNTRLEISSNDRIFALSHLYFDLSVYDIFGMLIAGGTIVIPDHEHYKNPKHWYDMMIKYDVTIWNSVPMLIQMLVEHLKHTYNNNQLRHILLSGDWISLSLPKSIQTTFGEQLTITSLGGATEASIWSIVFTLPKEIIQEWKSIPYGMPLQNQQYYVYDAHLDDCPEWVNGELYIGGVGLADGYWNDRIKTESSFIIHPRTGERLYRTGDYGRFIPNGYIQFIGRKDFQVKVHGHRIELGEIEYHLQQHPDIHQAIVTLDKNLQQLIGYVIPEKHSVVNDGFNESEILIIDSIERNNFKLARHGIQHQHQIQKSFTLMKPNLSETLINTYYERKSYRQFTNEIIEKSTIEYLLTKCYKNNFYKISQQSLDFDTLSQLLSVLTPINVDDQSLPKYRYASPESLYPIQVYIELHNAIDNIYPGLYYHNPNKHTLELIGNGVYYGKVNAHLHLVGRSSAIAPLYGKTLGSQFCILETGYIKGLLQQEASKLGFILSNITHIDVVNRENLDLNENDTHYCLEISSIEQDLYDDNCSDYPQCIIYMKSMIHSKDQWFIYDKENFILIPLDIGAEIIKVEIPLFFDEHDNTKVIFHDCQCAIFFIGQSEQRLNTGMMSHLLMIASSQMNIGICPIGTRSNLPVKINNTLDNILTHYGSIKGNIVLHTLFIAKISDEQKYERATSTIKTMPDCSEGLKTYLSEKLPMYMIPSHFITVSTFPMSSNGKIDRKSLPKISSSVLHKENAYVAPSTELEKTIAEIWQNLIYTDRLDSYHNNINSIVLKRSDFSQSNKRMLVKLDESLSDSEMDVDLNWYKAQDNENFRISTRTSFFNLGGDSLLLIQLYRHYQLLFGFDNESLTIRLFFEQNTIVQHAKLIETIVTTDTQSQQWQSLHITKGNLFIK
jgi:amino acid adenylation domain-containing protein